MLHQERRAFYGLAAAAADRMVSASRRARSRNDGEHDGQPERGMEFIHRWWLHIDYTDYMYC